MKNSEAITILQAEITTEENSIAATVKYLNAFRGLTGQDIETLADKSEKSRNKIEALALAVSALIYNEEKEQTNECT